MVFGENFPYTNFHDLNLDWIIQKLKEISNEYNSVKEGIETVESLVPIIEELENIPSLFAELENDFNNLKKTLTPMTNIICLTDSYGVDDATTDRKSWCEYLKEKNNLIEENTYRKIYSENAGFGNTTPANNFYNMFSTATQNMTDEEKTSVSDIIIEGGVHDWNYNNQTNILNNITSLAVYIASNFPNAKVWLFTCGWSKSANARESLKGTALSIYNLYKEYATYFGWNFIDNISVMILKSAYTDNINPSSSSSIRIANIIYNNIKYNTDIVYNKYVIYPVEAYTRDGIKNAGYCTFDGTKIIWQPITIKTGALLTIPEGITGESDLCTLSTDTIIGYNSETSLTPIEAPCVLGVQINNTWRKINGSIVIKEVDNTGYPHLFFKNNSEFSSIPTEELSNITDSYITISPVIIPVWD